MHKFMSEAELRHMEQRCQLARPGPWVSFVAGRDQESGTSYVMTGPEDSPGPDLTLIGATAEDQDFVAAARQVIPRLLEEVRLLHEILLVKNGIRLG